MRILELTGFCANYGSNFIPTLECLDETCQKLGHDLFYIFSDANPSQKFFVSEEDAYLSNYPYIFMLYR